MKSNYVSSPSAQPPCKGEPRERLLLRRRVGKTNPVDTVELQIMVAGDRLRCMVACSWQNGNAFIASGL